MASSHAVSRRALAPASSTLVSDYLDECRQLVLDEIRAFVPSDRRYHSVLYDLMLEYPLREAKALRPALCIAACRALGGSLEGVLKSAAVLEFYHNAFLIHDDVEDGSEKRRDRPTLHRAHGVPIAINVGDAMLALALEPLLDNMRLLGLGKALRILQTIARMARESAEGQALELSWIRAAEWGLRDSDYLRMVHKKTSHYTFITPVLIGGIVAGAEAPVLDRWTRFATALGLAFQIRDDVLNLSADEQAYGKEIHGDLWEGKHTLALLHALRAASPSERERAVAILERRRPDLEAPASPLETAVDELLANGAIRGQARARLLAARTAEAATAFKSAADVEFLNELIQRYGSLEYAHRIAVCRAVRARQTLALLSQGLEPSVHLDFLWAITEFVVERDH